jgi:hypothetical protein
VNPILEAALKYIERGWFVIPLNPGEKWLDAILDGRLAWDGITQTADEIERWLSIEPNLNIGIRMKESGLVVLDIDYPDDMPESLLARLHNCPHVLTPRGAHYYFAGTVTDVCGQIWADTGDFRTLLGDYLAPSPIPWREEHQAYVVAAPSVVNGQSYQWLAWGYSLEPVPDGIRDLVVIPSVSPRSWFDDYDDEDDDEWYEDEDYLPFGPTDYEANYDPDEYLTEDEEVGDGDSLE